MELRFSIPMTSGEGKKKETEALSGPYLARRSGHYRMGRKSSAFIHARRPFDHWDPAK